MKKIKLTNGMMALVDDEDYYLVNQFKWRSRQDYNTHYAICTQRIDLNGLGKHRLAMHRFLMNAQPGHILDHINRNGLDNRRCNLRFVTATENY